MYVPMLNVYVLQTNSKGYSKSDIAGSADENNNSKYTSNKNENKYVKIEQTKEMLFDPLNQLS